MLRTLPNKALAGNQQQRPSQAQTDTLPPQQPLLRRMWRHRYAMHYHRLIALVVIVNVVLLSYAIREWNWWAADSINLAALSNMVIANIAMAILIRQQYVVNLLFKIATSVPTSWPLRFRQLMGKVYHFGGIHVGGAIMGTLWFGAFTGSLIYSFVNGLPGVSVATMIVTGILLLLLIAIIALSMPQFRAKYHDQFEAMHRFGGWASLLLFWAQTILFINDQRGAVAFGEALLATPGFWVLLLVTFSIALPWLRLKKVRVRMDSPSNHVTLAHFDYGVTPFAGSSTAISRSPLGEWHSFANVPAPGKDGFRLTISRAGDWTGELIDDLPSHVWVKGIPTAGVGNIDKLFKRVVWIATGSGIGPTLPHLLAHTAPARLVWSTRTPRETYGNALVDEILESEPNALIWDTNANGRPDLVQLAYDAVQEFDAEAVIVISNKKLTWQVVYGMESRGIPAYGAIWDS